MVRQHVRRIKVRSRVKDAYSVWRKMERKGLAEVEELTLTLTLTRTRTLTLRRTAWARPPRATPSSAQRG